MIQYLVVFSLGKGASIGIGIIGSLVSALMLTGIGDGIWRVIPWGYSMRLSYYFVLYNANILIQKDEIIQGIFIMIIFIAIIFISQLIFSNRWEGRRENY
jgi:ABC-2 type transport system permease protein